MDREEFMRESGLDVWDRVELTVGEHVLAGIVIPSHDFSAPDIITLKLDNGYNVGIRVDRIDGVVVIGCSEPSVAPTPRQAGSDLPPVALIATGGTIASFVDYATGAVHPATSADEFLWAAPELAEICDLDVIVLSTVLSENVRPDLWRDLAREVKARLDAGARGVVVAHGTDTMAYTAAALAFMLPAMAGPVMLTGSQRSADRPSSDGPMNLAAALRVAAGTDLGEVAVVMHASMSDDRMAIHRGTRVRKDHTSRRDAFRTVDAAPLGIVEGETIELGEHRTAGEETVLIDALEERVSAIYAHPALDGEDLAKALDRSRGVILIGTGLGHVREDLIPVIAGAVEDGTLVGMTSQCIRGPIDMTVYRTGRRLLEAGVLPLQMTPEAAIVKAMAVLGREEKPAAVRELMMTDLAGEWLDRRLPL